MNSSSTPSNPPRRLSSTIRKPSISRYKADNAPSIRQAPLNPTSTILRAMSRQSQLDASFAIAHKLLQRLAELHLKPIPRNYMLWYASLDGTRPELAQELARTVEKEGGLSQGMVDALYDRQFSAGEDGEVLRKAADKIENSLGEVLGLLDEAGKDAGKYGQSLAGLGADLEGAPAAEDVRAVVGQILAATQDMSARAQGLETRLKASVAEVTALKRDLEDTRVEATTDALTGIGNRKHFEQRLKAAMAEADVEKAPLSLLLFDVDFFKHFNDTYGHQLGDEVLRLIGRELKNNIKGRDTAARYGGEEFAVVLPVTTLPNALKVAEQIRSQVERRRVVRSATGEVLAAITLSVGVAAYRHGEPVTALIERADAALYAAKHAGRNQVMAEAAPVRPLAAG
ncbi:MAG: GGDEF domain-containing protein [Alphaproteobacteria bacterium]|nr:GGDEF domain-containing protein [Alphaproteobacteria bacterium]